MPVISAFCGIIVRMFYCEHGPPHMHVAHRGSHAAVTFDGRLLAGTMPHSALRLVSEWSILHRVELEANWARARRGETLLRIEPLS